MDSTKLEQKSKEFFNKVTDLEYQGKFQESLELAYEMLSIFQNFGSEEYVFKVRKIIANNYKMLNRVKESLDALNELLKEYEEKYGKINYFIADILNQLGDIHVSMLSNLEQGIEYFHQSLDIYISITKENTSEVALIYNNLGYTYGELGDFDKQLLYYQKSLWIRQKIFGEIHRNTAESYNNLGFYYQEFKKDFKTALQYHQKALIIRKQVLPENHHLIAQTYAHLGHISKMLNKYSQAIEYNKKSLFICEEVLGKNHFYIGRLYNAIGDCYLNNGQAANSIEEFEKALSIYNHIFVDRHSHKAAIHYNYSIALLKLKKYDSALQRIHLAQMELLKEGRVGVKDVYAVYDVQDFKKSFEFVKISKEKANFFLHYFKQISQNEKDLEGCLNACFLGNQYIENQRLDYKTVGTQLELNKQAIAIYQIGLKAAIKNTSNSQNIQTAFQFSEKAKANLLLSSIQDSLAKASSNIPSILLQREKGKFSIT